MARGATGKLGDNIVHFARVLRAAGLPVGPDRIIAAQHALQHAGVDQRTRVHAALSAVLIEPLVQLSAGLGIDLEDARRVALALERSFAAPGDLLGLAPEAALVGPCTASLVPDGHPLQVTPAACMASVVTGSCRQSLKTIIRPPSVMRSKHKDMQSAHPCRYASSGRLAARRT